MFKFATYKLILLENILCPKIIRDPPLKKRIPKQSTPLYPPFQRNLELTGNAG